MPTIWLLIGAWLAGQTNARSDPQPLQRVAAAERAFAMAAFEQGWRDAALAFAAPDAIVVRLQPGDAPAREPARPLIETLPPAQLPLGVQEVWEPATGQVSSDGTFAWLTGGRTTLLLPTRSLANQGAFLHVWRRQPDGSWKVWLIDNVPFPDVWEHAAPFVASPEPDAGSAGLPGEALDEAERAVAGSSAAWRARLAAEVRVHRASTPPLAGRDAVEAWARTAWDGTRFSDVTLDTAGSDDIGIASGRYDRNGTRAEHGTWIRVWQRDVTGRWRIVLETSQPAR